MYGQVKNKTIIGLKSIQNAKMNNKIIVKNKTIIGLKLASSSNSASIR